LEKRYIDDAKEKLKCFIPEKENSKMKLKCNRNLQFFLDKGNKHTEQTTSVPEKKDFIFNLKNKMRHPQ